MPVILVIEDNEKSMKLLRDILRHRGYEALEARSGEDGVRLAIAHRPALILMDIQLPGISGITALGLIRAQPSLDAVPVVAVSASVMPEDQARIVHSGFDGQLSKPIALKSFIATVEHFLQHGRPAA